MHHITSYVTYYIFIYIKMYIYIDILYRYIYIYIYMHACIHCTYSVYIYTYLYISIHIYIYIYMHIYYIYVNIYHTCIYIYVHICLCKSTPDWPSKGLARIGGGEKKVVWSRNAESRSYASTTWEGEKRVWARQWENERESVCVGEWGRVCTSLVRHDGSLGEFIHSKLYREFVNRSGPEEGSYLRLLDSCITQL